LDRIEARLIDLPYPVRGLSAVDENGDPMIYLNARHSAVQHQLTYEHELRHLRGNDVYNDIPLEEAERIASGLPPVMELALPREPLILPGDLHDDMHSQLILIARMRAWLLYRLSPWDKAWKHIHSAFITEMIFEYGYGLDYVNRHRKPNPPLLSQFIRRLYAERFSTP